MKEQKVLAIKNKTEPNEYLVDLFVGSEINQFHLISSFVEIRSNLVASANSQ